MNLSGITYGPQIAAAAAAHGLDPALLAAVAAQETGGPGSSSGRNIVGDAGHGHGVFQIDDRTWDFAKTPAAMDPAKNADMAASILADNLQRYGGNVHEALSAYNSGSPTSTGTTTTWGDGATLGYADSVMRHYDALSGDMGAQVLADQNETSSSVNQLASYAAATTPQAPASGSNSNIVSSAVPLQATFTPPPPISYTSSGSQGAASIGADGDKQLGSLLDASDGLSDSDGGEG